MNITPDDFDSQYLYQEPKLLLDDDTERTPEAIYAYTHNEIYTFPNWDIVRNYNEFVNYIQTHEMPKLISLDHDLADVHYKTFLNPTTKEAKQKAWADYHEQVSHEKTGYDCLKWLIDHCHGNNILFPELLIHTMNTVGYENMVYYFRSALRNKFIKTR